MIDLEEKMINNLDFLRAQITANNINIVNAKGGLKLFYLEQYFETNTLADFLAAYSGLGSDSTRYSLAKKLFANTPEKNLYGLLINLQTAEIIWALRRDFFQKMEDEIIFKEADDVLFEWANRRMGSPISLVAATPATAVELSKTEKG